MMNTLTSLKTANDDFQVEYEILSPIDISAVTDKNRREIMLALQDVDKQINLCEDEIAKLSAEIDKLTNHADGLDYAVAVASGILTGLIDSFFVGETEINKEKIQNILQKKYHTANDDEYKHESKEKSKNTDVHNQNCEDDGGKEKASWISSTTYHRLDDLAHHPTILGLVASILVRYFRLVVFVDGKDGKPHIFFADTPKSEKKRKLEQEQLMKAWRGAIFSGLFMWLAHVVENKYEEAYEGDMPEALRRIIRALGKTPLVVEMLKTADTWVGHMMSDVSTEQGVPGVFLSWLKVISVLPVIRNTNLPTVVKNMYNDDEGKWNLSEWGGVVFVAAKKQAMPVLINETLVRGFYFVRHLILEFKEHDDIKEIDWEKTIPFGNRTVERMMTIASGTFTAVDIADAAIRSGGFNASCLLRVNFVGIGRFVVAIGVDIGMGVKRNELVNERIQVMGQQLTLLNAKVYYKCAQLHYAEFDMLNAEQDMWISAQDAEQTINAAYMLAEDSVAFVVESVNEINETMKRISTYRTAIEEKNPGLTEEIIRKLKY